MVNVAVLGYGTIGAGVVEVLQTNADSIEKKAGERIVVKRILDLREFPGDPNADKVVHDYKVIEEDEDIQIVVECMGGLEPAYTFVKTALLQGRSVATSNKELVAKYGAELIGIAEEKKVNFLFEASVGGGIPIIRPLTQCLTADVIEEISGILNGTTNYMLTKMEEEGADFDAVLKEAQEKGYAELHPEADIEGFDACRKIAILTSLAYGKQVDFEDIHTEGITNITAEDFLYARAMKKCIKLLGKSWSDDGKLYALVCPMLIDQYHPLAGVKDVFNAIFVHGNMVDDTMFYGQGAGRRPTASAVAADVVDCVKHMGTHIKIIWEQEKLPLSDFGDFRRRYFVRMPKEVSLDAVEKAFGPVEPVQVEGVVETAFVTGIMSEKEYHAAADQFDTILNMIRIDV
ncbi:MAG TPA: homoserine dehydrogenase [Candidatus Anaerobutyricum stercoripullorum]|uniref:Homoserine dehydrogenase n=1 Tax=Candidatus Anaerobutyricum stercoripullorum TaxID=2838456 RepID=A0A9D1X589_9FIRM|nr:homoserine dehydrogenase [Candidatus Anaerobutyricum stercoripullorum]